jgi:hypothetical protein
MTSFAHEANADGLDRLMALTPDPDRAEQVRARCRGRLVRRRRRAPRAAEITRFASRVLPPVVVGAFCVFYVAALVATTLRLQDIFH